MEFEISLRASTQAGEYLKEKLAKQTETPVKIGKLAAGSPVEIIVITASSMAIVDLLIKWVAAYRRTRNKFNSDEDEAIVVIDDKQKEVDVTEANRQFLERICESAATKTPREKTDD